VLSIGDREARFAIEYDGRPVELLRATHEGDRLGWQETGAANGEHELGFHARATFSVALALAGWPLLRARELFDEAAGADIGGPEVLARKIALFEWLDRRAGFPVRQPRIPGVPYDEIARYLGGPQSP
jgi:hypothetical protein